MAIEPGATILAEDVAHIGDLSLTAQEDLTAGQTVGVSSLSGKIARALRDTQSQAHNVANQAFTGARNGAYCPIGGDKFAYLLYSTDGSDTLYAQVGSIANNTLTLGTAVSVAAAFTPEGTALRNAAICKLDTDKFIVFYLLDSSTTAIKYRVGTVSGTTITFGSEATFFTAGSTVATSVAFCADQISTDKGIFVFKAATTTNSKMVAFTVSGTVATAGSGVTPGANSQVNDSSYVKKIATDKYVLVTLNSVALCYAQVCTLSGTTITAGTEVQISSTTTTSTYSSFQVVSPGADVFVVRWLNASTTINYVACTVSDTTPTAGTTISVASSGPGGLYAKSSSVLYSVNSTNEDVVKITLSGNTLTSQGIVLKDKASGAAASEATIAIDNGYFACLNLSSTTVNFWVEGMANNTLGIVQSTVSAGQTAVVRHLGKDSNQSNLSAGAYYVADGLGGLTLTGRRATTDAPDEMVSFLALSDTEVLVKI